MAAAARSGSRPDAPAVPVHLRPDHRNRDRGRRGRVGRGGCCITYPFDVAEHRRPRRKGRPVMDHLRTDLAPLSAAAWEQVKDVATRTLRTYLAGRALVD